MEELLHPESNNKRWSLILDAMLELRSVVLGKFDEPSHSASVPVPRIGDNVFTSSSDRRQRKESRFQLLRATNITKPVKESKEEITARLRPRFDRFLKTLQFAAQLLDELEEEEATVQSSDKTPTGMSAVAQSGADGVDDCKKVPFHMVFTPRAAFGGMDDAMDDNIPVALTPTRPRNSDGQDQGRNHCLLKCPLLPRLGDSKTRQPSLVV